MGAFYSRNRSYSRSMNAERAEESGRFPLSKAKAVFSEKYGMSQAAACRILKKIGTTEWHHVGRHANKVDYHNTNLEEIFENDPMECVAAFLDEKRGLDTLRSLVKQNNISFDIDETISSINRLAAEQSRNEASIEHYKMVQEQILSCEEKENEEKQNNYYLMIAANGAARKVRYNNLVRAFSHVIEQSIAEDTSPWKKDENAFIGQRTASARIWAR